MKVSIKKFDINCQVFVSLHGYTWQFGLNYTRKKLQTLQDTNMVLLLEINIRGGISSVLGDRYVKSDENETIFYIDAINVYVWAMSEYLPHDGIEMWHGHLDLYMKKLEEILNTLDESDIGFYIEVDFRYPINIKEKTKNFPFCPEKKIYS